MPPRPVIGRTHRPCGACRALVDLAELCEHTGRRPPPSPRRERATAHAVAMVDRAVLLAQLGYPKP